MSNPKDNYAILIEKLDSFIRKYYINNILRGGLYTIGLVIFSFITFAVLEHFFFFGTGGRKLMFYGFLGITAATLGWLVIKPLLQYLGLGKVISHEKAAHIVGDHFESVKDKLLNILQLRDQAESSTSAELLFASINQKSEKIKLVPFQSAIDLSNNRKYLKYALPPVMALLVLLFAAPSIITDSTNRILKNNQEFERAAPFKFSIDSDDLEVVQFQDYPLEIKVDGAVLPDEAFIMVDNYQYRLTKESPSTFSYNFSNVNKDTEFKIYSGIVSTEEYTLDVIEKPNIEGFDISLDFPAYTGRADERLSSIGDIIVPQGTKLNWVFNSKNTDELAIKFASQVEKKVAKSLTDDQFTFSKKAMADDQYTVYVSNDRIPNADSIAYLISVIPDLHPSISVERFIDSTDNKLLFFIGEASDDYGLSNLSFNYQITNEEGFKQPMVSLKLQQPKERSIQYDHTFDIQELGLEPGDQLNYYFEVFDNDGINGSKSSKTSLMAYEKPSIEEYEELAAENTEDIKKDLKEALKESKKIQEDFKKLSEKLIQEQELKWQDKKEMEKLLERQKENEKKIEEAKEKFDENLKNQQEFEQPKEDILEKQERLQEMFEEMQNPEMQELMEKMQELMQELEKDMSLEMMEDMQMSNEEMEMQLDRMIEMVKQLEVEKAIKDQLEKLEKLAEEQEKLAEETEEGKKSQEELEKEQDKLNEEFEKFEEKMEEIEEKNQELEKPKDIGKDEEQIEDIKEDMQDSKEQMQKQENSKSSKSQKSAAQKMKKMAQAMSMEMQSGEMEQMQEDMAALRQLLENLIGLSFDQEELIDNIGASDINTPNYVELVRDQYKLKDDFQLVQDSLTMKNVNDLALMLNESMEQMQQQMSGMMSGSQMCKKPGEGNPQDGNVPMDKIGEGQKELNEKMKGMKEGMDKGGEGGSAKDFAKMAAQQAALRKALRELADEKKGQGNGSKEIEDLIEEMNKIETELVNKRLNNEMLERQQDILTRLLESDKAQREKEMEQKRKAESAKQKDRTMPPSLEEYLKKREREVEQFNKVSPALRPYYKQLVEEYFKELKKKG